MAWCAEDIGHSATLYRGRMQLYNTGEQSTRCAQPSIQTLRTARGTEPVSAMMQHRDAASIVGMTQNFTEAQRTRAVHLVVHWAGTQ